MTIQPLFSYNKHHHNGNTFENPRGNLYAPEFEYPHGKKAIEVLLGFDKFPPLPIKEFKKSFAEIAIWHIGHATILIKVHNNYILTDPIFSNSCSPIPFHYRRITPAPISISDLPPISLVLISHSHYDHLDCSSLTSIHLRFPDCKFFVPLRVGSIIQKLGIKCDEFDWRTKTIFYDANIYCFPAVHNSFRGIMGAANETLWCSWMIEYKNLLIYFCGDTAIGPHFQEIRNHFKRGVDLMLTPIGPQEPQQTMRANHLDGNDAFRMSNIIEAKIVVPIHYGVFSMGASTKISDLQLVKQAFNQDNRLLVLDIGEKCEYDGVTFVIK